MKSFWVTLYTPIHFPLHQTSSLAAKFKKHGSMPPLPITINTIYLIMYPYQSFLYLPIPIDIMYPHTVVQDRLADLQAFRELEDSVDSCCTVLAP
jgi:hypothetical protein